jgi:hypothetical protein
MNHALEPPMPVFCSEAYYERADALRTAAPTVGLAIRMDRRGGRGGR